MSNEQVVNVPLTGGINQDDDVLAVSPPDMLELKNVSVVKRGALDRRFGFEAMVMEAGGRLVPIDAYPAGPVPPPENVLYGTEIDFPLEGMVWPTTVGIADISQPVFCAGKIVCVAIGILPNASQWPFWMAYDVATNTYQSALIAQDDWYDLSRFILRTNGTYVVIQNRAVTVRYDVANNTSTGYTGLGAVGQIISKVGNALIGDQLYAIDNYNIGGFYRWNIVTTGAPTNIPCDNRTKKILGYVVRNGETRLLCISCGPTGNWNSDVNRLKEVSIVDGSEVHNFGAITYLLGPNGLDANEADRSVWVAGASRAYLVLNGNAFMIDYADPTPSLVDITPTLASIPGFITGAGWPIQTVSDAPIGKGGGLSIYYDQPSNTVWFASCPVSGASFSNVAVGLNGTTGAVSRVLTYTPTGNIRGVAQDGNTLVTTHPLQVSPTASITGANLYEWGDENGTIVSAYRGLTGEIEALSEHTSAAGSNLVTISGGEFFEHVGVDAANATKDRNWRYVNDVPKYVGTLVSVASTGGPIIEIESMLFDNDTKRATVWVTGTRNGAELVSERSLLDQSAGDHNSVYYSVQRVENDSYLVPPTRVFYGNGTPVTSAINLKLAFVNPGAGSGTNAASTVVLAWYNKAAVQIEYALMDADSGELRTVYSFARTHAALGFVSCHRNFDIVGIPDANAAPTAILVTCPEETLAPSPGPGVFNPAPLPAVVVTFNYTTGAASTRATVSNILSSVQSIPVGAGWRIVANRGVVLENEPTYIQTSSSTWTVSVAVSLRVLAVSYDGSGNPGVADCQMLLGTLDATFTDGFPVDTYTLAARGYKAIPNIGFQTQDYLDVAFNGLALNGPTYPSGSFQTGRKWFLGAASTVTYPASDISNANSQVSLALTIGTSSLQQYWCWLAPSLGGAQTLNGFNPRPARGSAVVKWDAIYELYAPPVRPVRQYPNNAPLQASQTIVNDAYQINLIDFSNVTVNTGFNPGAYVCTLRYFDGVNVADIASVGVYVDTLGSIAATEIFSSLPGWNGAPFNAPPPYNYALRYIEDAGIANLYFVGAGLGAGTITGLRAWNLTAGMSAGTGGAQTGTGTDTQDRTYVPPVGSSKFLFFGQQEDCVHRWSVAHSRMTDGSSTVTFALSSTAGSKLPNPNGAAALQSANPFGYNNFCEFYGTTIPLPMSTYESLVPAFGGTVSTLKCALGGPWRLVGSLVRVSTDPFDSSSNQYYCAVCPSADDTQASTFLVRVTNGAVTLTVPNASGVGEKASYPSPSDVSYGNNIGVFVDAANAMRVTSPPFNVPTLMRARQALSPGNTNLTMGLLRNGSSRGSQECLALHYESNGKAWRKMLPFDDYTFVNGGVLSVFDGVNCGEWGHLLWPQRDFTSIAWGDGGAQPANLTTITSKFFKNIRRDGALESPLEGVTRPFFLQESGFRDFNISVAVSDYDTFYNLTGSNAWGSVSTAWGGTGAQNYEYVSIDIRAPHASPSTTDGMLHYYGRYHINGTLWNNAGNPTTSSPVGATPNAVFVWAPRSAQGWESKSMNLFNQQDTAGNFMMSFCYEYADGTGRMVRSAPSMPITYTICAEIEQPWITKTTAPGDSFASRTISLFKWGFLAPRLELTNRRTASSTDARRNVLQPYTTAEPYSTVMYRMPWSNFENPIGDFVINRNVTRGVVPRATTPWNSDAPCGFVTRNIGNPWTPGATYSANAVFDGPQGEYNGILSQPYLYTAGGVLDNVAPPGCKSMCIHQNRLVIGGADDPTVVWFSKQLSPTDAPGFNDLLTISIEQGGAVTGLASMNSNLIVFKRNTIFVIAGTMPDDTGNANGLAEPVQLQSGIGCTDHRSIIETPVGVFFRSERGLELLTPSLQVVPIGDKVVDSLNAYKYVPSCVHNAKAEEIYFIGHEQAPTHETTSSYFKCLVYSYRGQSWYEWVLAPLGDGYAFMTSMAGVPYIATKTAAPDSSTKLTTVYKLTDKYVDKLPNLTPSPTPSYALSYPGISFSLAPIAMNQVQGFQRLKRIRLNGFAFISVDSSAPTVSFAATPDGISVGFSTWTPAQLLETLQGTGLLGLEMHQPYQKGQFISFAFQETTNTPDENSNLRLSNIAMVVGLKTGLNKRTTEQAKH